MPEYHFITHWRIPGQLQEVAEVLADAPDMARWWPSVYLEVKELARGDEQGIGREIDLYTKGWLPYTLRWQFRVVASEWPHNFTIESRGDFVGRGIWTLAQEGEWVNVTYDWKIRAEKPLLRYLTPILRPIFTANHHWAMDKGSESLKLELARRRAKSPEELALIPPPPPPTSSSPLPMMLMGAAVLLVIVWLWRK
jgi:hypothetical protein